MLDACAPSPVPPAWLLTWQAIATLRTPPASSTQRCLWLAHWGLHIRACHPVKWELFVCDLSFGPLPISYAETGFCKSRATTNITQCLASQAQSTVCPLPVSKSQQQQEQYYLQPVSCTAVARVQPVLHANMIAHQHHGGRYVDGS